MFGEVLVVFFYVRTFKFYADRYRGFLSCSHSALWIFSRSEPRGLGWWVLAFDGASPFVSFMQSTDAVVAGARPLSRLDSSPRPLAEELRYGLWGVVLWLAASFRILAGEMLRETQGGREGEIVAYVYQQC